MMGCLVEQLFRLTVSPASVLWHQMLLKFQGGYVSLVGISRDLRASCGRCCHTHEMLDIAMDRLKTLKLSLRCFFFEKKKKKNVQQGRLRFVEGDFFRIVPMVNHHRSPEFWKMFLFNFFQAFFPANPRKLPGWKKKQWFCHTYFKLKYGWRFRFLCFFRDTWKNVAQFELKTNSGWLGEKPTRSKVQGSHGSHSPRKKGPKTVGPGFFGPGMTSYPDISLGIQSPCQMMIGVYSDLLRKVFRFHYHSQKVIGSLGYKDF